MLGVAAQRIAWPMRKPGNNADECLCAETRRDGAFRAICFVAPLARGACHGRRVASRISSRKASVAATRDLFRGSLGLQPVDEFLAELRYLGRDDELAIGLPAIALEIQLVIRLGFVERRCI